MRAPAIGERALAPALAEIVDRAARAFVDAWQAPEESGRGALARSLGIDKKGALTYQSAKLEHTSAPGAILYLAPSASAGAGLNVCPNASGCVSPCLAESAGRMRFRAARAARRARSLALFQAPESFGRLLAVEARALVRRARRVDPLARPMLRLDGGSDLGIGQAIVRLAEDAPPLADPRAALILFDYTKSAERARGAGAYPLAFSVTRRTLGAARELGAIARERGRGAALALVVDAPRGAALPERIGAARAIDGDATGEGWALLPPRARAGAIILLRFKGPRGARLDAARRAGFVFSLDDAREALT